MELLRKLEQALEESHFKMQEPSLQVWQKYLMPQLVELFCFG